MQWIVLTLLGAIPGPVLFGIFIDKTCDLWESTCQGQGNCLVYDNKKLSYQLAAAIFIFEGMLFNLSLIFFKLFFSYIRPFPEKNLLRISIFSKLTPLEFPSFLS